MYCMFREDGVSKLISWGIHKTFAQKLEDFKKKQQLIDAVFLKALGISEEINQLTV